MAAALFFLGGGAALCAMLAASAVHELGHLAAMDLAGGRVRRLRLTGAGAVLEYSGDMSPGQQALVLAAGPLAGLCMGLLCLAGDSEFYRLTGQAALLASGFNLLPALPLDGGRLLELGLGHVLDERRLERWMRLSGSLCAGLLIAGGLWSRLIVLSAAGIWLGVLVNFPGLR